MGGWARRRLLLTRHGRGGQEGEARTRRQSKGPLTLPLLLHCSYFYHDTALRYTWLRKLPEHTVLCTHRCVGPVEHNQSGKERCVSCCFQECGPGKQGRWGFLISVKQMFHSLWSVTQCLQSSELTLCGPTPFPGSRCVLVWREEEGGGGSDCTVSTGPGCSATRAALHSG